MGIFSELGEFGTVTIALLAIALVGGLLAVLVKKYAKKILIATGAAAGAAMLGGLIYFATLKDVAGTVYEGIELGTGLYIFMVIVLLAFMVAAMVISGRKKPWTTRGIAFAAMCVAMSFILSCIKFYELPQGGSVTPASLLPMMLYILAFGPARGLVVGCAYGLLQLFQGAYVIHPIQLLVDYPMAFGALALGGFVNYIKMPERFKLPAAVLLGYVGRWIMSVLSGVIFFAEYAGEQNAMVYSIVYNATYLSLDCLACVAVAFIPGFGKLVQGLRKR